MGPGRKYQLGTILRGRRAEGEGVRVRGGGVNVQGTGSRLQQQQLGAILRGCRHGQGVRVWVWVRATGVRRCSFMSFMREEWSCVRCELSDTLMRGE